MGVQDWYIYIYIKQLSNTTRRRVRLIRKAGNWTEITFKLQDKVESGGFSDAGREINYNKAYIEAEMLYSKLTCLAAVLHKRARFFLLRSPS